MWQRSALCLVVGLLSVVGSTGAKFVISKDEGNGAEDHEIKDLRAFLDFAGLGTDYAAPLQAEGVSLIDLEAITDEELEAIGVKKIMHRSRFLRYAKQLREVPDGAPAPPPKKPAADKPASKKQVKKSRKDTSAPRAGTPDAELAKAVEAEDVEGVKAALSAGATVDVMMPGEGGDMMTALMYSSLVGFEKGAELLLQHGADLTAGLAQAEYTPLHGAAFQGRPGIIKLLLAAGADPLHRHADGFIPMHRACWGNTPKHTESVLAFLEHGVDVSIDAENPDGDGSLTPLEMAATNPMTTALIQEWQRSGRKPQGAVSEWGDALDSSDAAGKEDL